MAGPLDFDESKTLYDDQRYGLGDAPSGTAKQNTVANALAAQLSNGLLGSDGNDLIEGGAGNDTLDGGDGIDTLIGGDGSDTYYVRQSGDVVIETNPTASTGGTDTVYSYLSAYTLPDNVENGRIMATGTANLTGNDLNNLLYAGPGNNVLNGSAGIDTVSYAYGLAGTTGVTVNLAVTTAQATGGSGTDTLISIENLEGSAYADRLTGNSDANILSGGAGSDILDGGDGIDTMIGGDGSDSYYVRQSDDVVIETNATASTGGSDLVYSYLSAYTLTANVENGRIMSTGTANLTGNGLNNLLYAGQGQNIINGGAGIDTVSYAFGVNGTTGVTISLNAASQLNNSSGIDVLRSIENVVGSAYADRLTGTSASNILSGGAGNDTIDGGWSFTGTADLDTLIGGDGTDTYYLRREGDVVIETNATASTGGTDLVYIPFSGYTLPDNVENGQLNINEAADLTGNSLDNRLAAAYGDNVLDGGAGNDTVTYAYGLTAGVTVSLAVTTVQATGGSNNDTLISIENLVGSSYDDRLTGNDAANSLSGGIGNDTLDGGAGLDTMIGGDGNDSFYVRQSGDVVIETNARPGIGAADTVYSYLSAYTLTDNIENGHIMASGAANLTGNALSNLLYAGQDNNVIDGGGGVNTVSYAYATAGVTASLAVTTAQVTGGSGSDTLIAIKNLEGSAYADKLTGNSMNNALSGGAGNDTLDGGTGYDILTGGDGNDTYYLRKGDAIIETNATASTGGTDMVYSFLSAYTLSSNIENGRIMTTGAADLTGNGLNNVLAAGLGNNVLNGGAGIDTVSYTFGVTGTSTIGVTVSLAVTTAQTTGGSGSDTLIAIENLVGSAQADKLTGNSAANSLSGGTGNDTLEGGTGNDLLIGGLGLDKLYGGSGADRFDFNALNETGLGAALRDVIGDFKSSEGDKIDLSTLDANLATPANDAFTFIGTNVFSSNATAQLRFADGILYGSVDADANAEFEIQLLGVSSLQVSDLIA